MEKVPVLPVMAANVGELFERAVVEPSPVATVAREASRMSIVNVLVEL
jgi:hypothetical protein